MKLFVWQDMNQETNRRGQTLSHQLIYAAKLELSPSEEQLVDKYGLWTLRLTGAYDVRSFVNGIRSELGTEQVEIWLQAPNSLQEACRSFSTMLKVLETIQLGEPQELSLDDD